MPSRRCSPKSSPAISETPSCSGMADIFSNDKRSAIMSRIRCAGTAPERRLYAMVREIVGPRRRVQQNVTTLPGRPDIVIPSSRLIIFADGCFYHSCPAHGHEPKSNQEYWTPKLARNVRHAASSRRKLRAMGYSVWRVWEHDLKGAANIARTFNRLRNMLVKRGISL